MPACKFLLYDYWLTKLSLPTAIPVEKCTKINCIENNWLLTVLKRSLAVLGPVYKLRQLIPRAVVLLGARLVLLTRPVRSFTRHRTNFDQLKNLTGHFVHDHSIFSLCSHGTLNG